MHGACRMNIGHDERVIKPINTEAFFVSKTYLKSFAKTDPLSISELSQYVHTYFCTCPHTYAHSYVHTFILTPPFIRTYMCMHNLIDETSNKIDCRSRFKVLGNKKNGQTSQNLEKRAKKDHTRGCNFKIRPKQTIKTDFSGG